MLIRAEESLVTTCLDPFLVACSPWLTLLYCEWRVVEGSPQNLTSFLASKKARSYVARPELHRGDLYLALMLLVH